MWSEKGTIRGVLAPVLDEYAVGFRVMHGFSSATVVNDIAQDDDGREVIALYVGDFDPSGMNMSEHDLPNRLEKYNGSHVTVRRIALTRAQVRGLPSFPQRIRRRTRVTSGSSATTGIVAGKSTRWTRTTFAPASGMRSWS